MPITFFPNEVIRRQTNPAELMSAPTRHMVASLGFLYISLAFWTRFGHCLYHLLTSSFFGLLDLVIRPVDKVSCAFELAGAWTYL